MGRRHSVWEILVMLIVGAMLIQIAVEMIQPLIPYILIAAFIGAMVPIGTAIYRRNRNW